jgi:hypothetical protein
LFADILCRPLQAQIATLLFVGVGHYWHVFVLDVALVVALDSYVVEERLSQEH